ncbi:Nif11-like leader peptide family natural product precursor [Desulfolutivibrio sp.]|uniref:Nif11-like leader peptide family natural product precursor n=1 Tax=Desulfolutivibrio sp. TaxID=2773296 RepID=UPI002F9629C1
MSQDDIDRLMAYLREHPVEMQRVHTMLTRELVAFAAMKGFEITEEELQARQALVHLINGT